MALDQSDVNAAKSILEPGEEVVMTARQRRVGPGGSVTTPTSVLATTKRVIIINRATLGVRKDFETIPYTQITSVRLEKGIISSSVFVRVEGFANEKGLLEGGKEEGEIDGLSGKEAQDLADYINKMLLQVQEGGNAGQAQNEGGYKDCSKCGTKNEADAKYCVNCGAVLETPL